MSEQSEMANRRRHPRLEIRAPIRMSTIDPESDPVTGRSFFRTITETCANLSRGGAYVLTSDPLAPGRRVLLEIDVPGGDRPIEAIGRIAWTQMPESPRSSEGGQGIQFLGGTPDHLARLEALLGRRDEEC